jgi:phosphoglycerate kinase
MIAFQELLPSAGGRLLIDEVNALTRVVQEPARPCVFFLGGLRIADAFGMMRQALSSGIADFILTGGVTGQVMLMARGVTLGERSENFIKERSLNRFIDDAKEYLQRYPGKIVLPDDVATAEDGKRQEFPMSKLPVPGLITDIGAKTVASMGDIIMRAGTVFFNGPPGVYEEEASSNGTESLWKLIASAPGYSVIGGGDTISSASRFIDTGAINYVCTAGGALIRFLSGVDLPLLSSMERAYHRYRKSEVST